MFSVEANAIAKGCLMHESSARNVLRVRFSFRGSIVEPSGRENLTLVCGIGQQNWHDRSDSAIDLPEAEDVFDNFCDMGFRASREIRTAFFHPVRLLAGSTGPIFKIQGDKYPL
jgi:hypothetical protein